LIINFEVKVKMKLKAQTRGSWKFFGLMAVLVIALGFAIRFFAGENVVPEDTDKAEALFTYRQSYIGDVSKLAGILEALPLAEYRGSIALQTDHEPYELTVFYDLQASGISPEEIARSLQQNAAIIFALVDNASIVSFQVQGGGETDYRFTRSDLAATFVQPLADAAASAENFRQFYQDAQLWIEIWPRQYARTMSSAPGMRIRPVCPGEVAKIEYTADQGVFLTWAVASGIIDAVGNAVSLPLDREIYWTPGEAEGLLDQMARLEVVARDGQGARKATRQVMIREVGGFFSVPE
jgi:hypothetical protein